MWWCHRWSLKEKRDSAQSGFILTAHTGRRRLAQSHCFGAGSTHPARPGPAASRPPLCQWVRGRQVGFPSELLSRPPFCSAPKCQLSFCSRLKLLTAGEPFGLLCVSRLGAQLRQMSSLSFDIRLSPLQMFVREPEPWQANSLKFPLSQPRLIAARSNL